MKVKLLRELRKTAHEFLGMAVHSDIDDGHIFYSVGTRNPLGYIRATNENFELNYETAVLRLASMRRTFILHEVWRLRAARVSKQGKVPEL